jgi:hypothetical protein
MPPPPTVTPTEMPLMVAVTLAEVLVASVLRTTGVDVMAGVRVREAAISVVEE